MDANKSYHYDNDNERRLKTIEEHRSQEDQTLERIVSTSPIKFHGNKNHTQPTQNTNQLNTLHKNKLIFQNLNSYQQHQSIQTSKISHHRRNKTQMSSVTKNKQKDPIYNQLFVPFLQTKSFDFGRSLNGLEKSKGPKRKSMSNPKGHSHSVSDPLLIQHQKRYSHREKKVSLPGIPKRQSVKSSIQVNQYKKSTQNAVQKSTTLNIQSRKSAQKFKNTTDKPFITTTSIVRVSHGSNEKSSSFRLPIEAKNVRDFKANDRQNKLSNKRKTHREKQWKQVNYLQLKTCYYHIDKKIASTSMIATDSNIKLSLNKDKEPELKDLKKNIILHERMPKVAKFPQVIEQVSLLIKNFHSMRKNKISINKLIQSKQFTVKFVEKQFLYFGELKNQKFHGYGVLVKPDYVFEGQWKEGQKVTGIQCKKGIFFEGDFFQNKKIGFGVSYSNNGFDQFSGEWKDGMKNGNGVWKNLDGDQYIGQWVNGKVEGFGVHTTGDGQKYQGFFTNFLKQGKGKQTFANGDEYEGNFMQGKPSGQGVYKFHRTQAVYEGNFQKGLRHGQGKFIVPNVFEYSGQFNMDNVSGYGKLICVNNDCYIGNFRDGVRHGKGSLHKMKQRVILSGYWKNGEYFEKEAQSKK